MKSQVLIRQLAGSACVPGTGQTASRACRGLRERVPPQHTTKVSVAAPILSKTCFALEEALNPSLHAATLQSLLKLDSELCKEQQRVFRSSLLPAVTAAAAQGAPTSLCPRSSCCTTHKQAQSTHCSRDKDSSARKGHHSPKVTLWR